MKLTIEAKLFDIGKNFIEVEMRLDTVEKQYVKTTRCPSELYDNYEEMMLDTLFNDMRHLIKKEGLLKEK